MSVRIIGSLIALLAIGCSALPASTPPSSLSSPAASEPPATSVASLPTATTANLALCDAVPYITAPESWYREEPIYVANEMDDDIQQIRPWAARQPGFVDVWIDRSHNGWITVAFTGDVEARQQDLEQGYPGV